MQQNGEFQAKYMQCKKLQKIQTEEAERYIGGFSRRGGGGRGRWVYRGTQGLGLCMFLPCGLGWWFHRLLSPQSLYITVLSSLPHDVILFWKQSLQRLLVEMKWHWNKVGPESSMPGVLNQKSTTWTGKPCDGRETLSPSQGTQQPGV